MVAYATVSVVEAIIGAIFPIVSAKALLNITDGLVDHLILTAFAILALDLILYTCFFFKGIFYEKIYYRVQVNLQMALAKETLKLEIFELDKANSGLFIDRLNKDTEEISDIFMEYTYWISNTLSKVGVLFAIFILNKYIFVYSLFTSIGIYLIYRRRLSYETKARKRIKELNEKKTSLVGELVRGIRDVKVLNASKNVLNQTRERITDSAEEERRLFKIRRLYDYFENSLSGVFHFIFIIFGCFLYKNALLTIPSFVILYNYQDRIQGLLDGVTKIAEFNKKFILSSNRIFEIIDGDKFKKETFGDVHVQKLEGNIDFVNVDFSYNKGKKILDKMSFSLKANERIAFVGKSGAGKTTIFSLITKLYHIDKGKILIDGISIDDLDESSLRDNMSIITQNPYIFNFSIKDNLLLAKENATMKEIREACKLACIDDFIMSLPHKYSTLVGENGVILSGGQKQRIAIARALLMKTEIILFDEATSALDNETQSEIQKAIDNLTGEYTILIVAHRLSTIIDCDKIYIVDDGKIIDSGTHKELLKKSSFYKNLYKKELE